MNIFNRVIVVLLLLLLLALGLLTAAYPIQTVGAVQGGLAGFAAFLARANESYYWFFIAGRVLIGLIALALCGWLLWKELRRRRPRAVRVHTEGGSNATLTTESVSRRLAWHLDQLADVISATPEVTPAGKAVNVQVNLETRPEIDVPMKTDEVVSVIKEVVTERMGLQLGKVQVQIKHAPYQEEA